MKVLVETSARHVHLSKEDFVALFGKEELTRTKDLSQPGQYACAERVEIVGPKRSLSGVVILGPFRPATQVELSATDCRGVGIPIAVRESGMTEGTPGCKIVGPAGEIEISEGVIVAKRHLHTTPADAEKLGVSDKEIIGIKIDSGSRQMIMGDVVVRVNEAYATAVHIDTDESNAGEVKFNGEYEIVKFA